jgi:hypothetical protein
VTPDLGLSMVSTFATSVVACLFSSAVNLDKHVWLVVLNNVWISFINFETVCNNVNIL